MNELKALHLTKTLANYLTASKVKAEEAEILIVGGQKFVVSDFPRLRGVFKVGVGTENIDFAALRDAQVEFRGPSAATSAVIYDETASFACHLIMSALYRTTGDFDTWQKIDRTFIQERFVLLIGRGNIGSRVEALLSPILKIRVFDLADSPIEELESQLERAEVVSLHIPGSEENESFVNADFLARMRNGATLINTSRGSLVDETALLNHLVDGRLYAYLDVFSDEPYSGPLISQIGNNLFVTPHVASTSSAFHQGLVTDLQQYSIELSA